MIYNTIKHDIRNKANLSLLDYCLLESIYLLSNSDKSKYKTWCNAAKSNFEYLASSRTIVTRFNELEALGWLEFKDESRFLKRTTQKYYEDVYAYILGVKKLHGEETAPMKELHGGGEETALEGVKELHPPREETAPNNTIDNTIDNNNERESKKGTPPSENSELEDLKKQLLESNEKLAALEAEKEKEKKLAAKKEKAKHEFPKLNTKPAAQLKPPKHAKDLEDAFFTAEGSENLKPYQIAVQNYHFNGWTETLKEAFFIFCEGKFETTKGKFGGTQAKETVKAVEADISKHGIERVEKCLRLCARRGWAYEINYQINQESRDKEDELKRQKQQANDPTISTVEVALRARYGDDFSQTEHEDGVSSTGLKWYEVHQQPEQEF